MQHTSRGLRHLHRFLIFCGLNVAFVTLGLSTTAGCAKPNPAKADLGRLSFALDALRRAPNASKETALRSLENVPCAAPEICDLKQVCATAYTMHLQAIEATNAARQNAATESSANLQKLLGLADEVLSRARDMIATCNAQEGNLRRQFGL